jgi:hypothetical protein
VRESYVFSVDGDGRFRARRVGDLKHYRYTFCVIKKDDYVYAIGGRGYGADDVALLKSCERYHISSGTWEEIGSLNF